MAVSAPLQSSIKYGKQTILLPCSHETSAETLIEDALQNLGIPKENSSMYTLSALADEIIPIEPEYTIDDVYQLFPPTPNVIPLALTEKTE